MGVGQEFGDGEGFPDDDGLFLLLLVIVGIGESVQAGDVSGRGEGGPFCFAFGLINNSPGTTRYYGMRGEVGSGEEDKTHEADGTSSH